MTKTRRHRLIAKLITSAAVPNQAQLQSLLLANGVKATQGTISRDLRELGVIKAPGGYTLSPTLSNGRRPTSDLEAALERYMLSVEPAGTIVVLRTEPGHAMALATVLDLNLPAGVVGTVAGDDTIFMAMRTPREARTATLQLQKLGGIL
ncbi:MAG: arginine repressor [Planctomycetota bacterium]|nr:arginine repressor [Planctomycetota bacterium]